MNGYDPTGTGVALAKQILMDCQGEGNITLPKETLRIVVDAFILSWKGQQDKTRSGFQKAAT